MVIGAPLYDSYDELTDDSGTVFVYAAENGGIVRKAIIPNLNSLDKISLTNIPVGGYVRIYDGTTLLYEYNHAHSGTLQVLPVPITKPVILKGKGEDGATIYGYPPAVKTFIYQIDNGYGESVQVFSQVIFPVARNSVGVPVFPSTYVTTVNPVSYGNYVANPFNVTLTYVSSSQLDSDRWTATYSLTGGMYGVPNGNIDFVWTRNIDSVVDGSDTAVRLINSKRQFDVLFDRGRGAPALEQTIHLNMGMGEHSGWFVHMSPDTNEVITSKNNPNDLLLVSDPGAYLTRSDGVVGNETMAVGSFLNSRGSLDFAIKTG